jgi:hypothetical protein
MDQGRRVDHVGHVAHGPPDGIGIPDVALENLDRQAVQRPWIAAVANQHANGPPLMQQLADKVVAKQPRGSGHQYGHVRSLRTVLGESWTQRLSYGPIHAMR